MPLKTGGKEAVQYNIREMYRSNESKPAGKQRSRKQMIAIAFSAAKRRRK